MHCIFPFEKAWYAEHAPKLRVEFVGHPFAEKVKAEAGGIEREKKLVLILPGSREREVAKIFPIMAAIVDRMPNDLEFIAAAVNEQSAAMMMSHPRIKVELGTAHELMQHATLAITASGTATMECAFYGCPMIVVYKVNWLTYLVGRMVVQVDWLGMPNVIAGREIVPEFIQHAANPDRVAVVARELMKNDAKREAMQRELATVVASLGGAGASERAAKLIIGSLQA
jgi:lipid-A-disaccharide synthase